MENAEKLNRLYDLLETLTNEEDRQALEWAIRRVEKTTRSKKDITFETEEEVYESLAILKYDIEHKSYYSALDEAYRLPKKLRAYISQVDPYKYEEYLDRCAAIREEMRE